MDQRYAFGRNWKRFLRKAFDEDRQRLAGRKLLKSFKLTDLRGRTFLDIGSGSGLHSMAAFKSGASRIVSFDYDHDSVEATRWLWQQCGSPEHWTVMQGDVLDREFLASLEPADVVYSWGVLHHTGDVWQAVRNAATLMAPNGVFLVALYTTDAYQNPEFALAQKRRYNSASQLQRRRMEAGYIWWTLLRPNLLRPWVPLKVIRSYRKDRGMSYFTDVCDWLGGWPMQFCGVGETRALAEDELGLELLACYAIAINTEYVFRRRGELSYWDETMVVQGPESLESPFDQAEDRAFSAALPGWAAGVDEQELELTEGSRLLGPSGAQREQVARCGAGAFMIDNDRLFFSSSDGSDPNSNGRMYSLAKRVSA